MTNTDAVTTALQAILGPVAEERDRLKLERADLIRQREDKDREIARMDKVLRAAGMGPQLAVARKSKRSKVAPDTLARVREAVVALAATTEHFTQGQVKVDGLSEGTVSNAFTLFREEDFIRLIKRGGRDVHGAYLYALMNKES